MRDPARIVKILGRLLTVWEAHPDLRLGQLIINAAMVRPNHLDPFYIEDEVLISKLEALVKSTRPVEMEFEGDSAPLAAEGLIFKHEGKYFRTNANGGVERLPSLDHDAPNRRAFETVLGKIPDDDPVPGDE
jgi:hypothetical protein